jgi:dipeptidase
MNFRQFQRILSKKGTFIPVVLFFLLSLNVFPQTPGEDFNCFSILAGKDATQDGSVLFAHNEDDYGTRLVNIYKVPRLTHAPGEMIASHEGAEIPEVTETNEFLWIEMPEMEFSDCYMNEFGVTIGSDACESREDQPELTEGGIGYLLRNTMAQRAKSAREAVAIAGMLIAHYGYTGSGRTYCIADTHEAWMLAVVNGKHWVAQRIPDDKVAVIPNYYTIGEIDLNDTVNFLGSPDLIDYAVHRGWYDPQQDGRFKFRNVYATKNSLDNMVNVVRMWHGVNLLSLTQYEIDDDFPFAFLPQEKLSLEDLMAILRDHYEGTKYDPSKDYTLGSPHFTKFSTICAMHTQYGFVAQLRDYLPVDYGAVLWLSLFRPCLHPFTPWYNGINDIPRGYFRNTYITAGAEHFNPPGDLYERSDTLAFWTFVTHMEMVDQNYGELIPKERKKRNDIEKASLNGHISFEQNLIFKYQDDPVEVRKKLTRYTNDAAERAWNEYRK